MKLEDRFMIAESEAEKAVEIAKGEKSKESLEKFSNICKNFLERKDALMACIFASGVSNYLDEDYKKIFNVSKFQNLIISSGDEELIYKFGRDVKDADIKLILSSLKSNSAKHQIENDMKML